MVMSVLLSCCRRAVHQCSAWWINLRFSYISSEQLSLVESGHGLTFAYEISSKYSLILDISQNKKKQNNKEDVCIGPFSTLEVS